MNFTNPIIIAIIVAIIAIILAIYAATDIQLKNAKKYIPGMWIGDKHFLESSGLKDMQLFISPLDEGQHQGYLIMIGDNDQFISNQALTIPKINFSTIGAIKSISSDKNQGNMKIMFDTVESWPSDVKFTLSILNGTLAIHDNENIYAFLTKDIATSHTAIAAYDDHGDLN
jgi:hypothetical protein